MKIKENYRDDKSIGKYFGFNLKMLSFIGLEFRLNNSRIIYKSRTLQKLPIFLTNALGIIAVQMQILYIRYTLSRDTDLTAQTCCELFSNVLCISKSFRVATSVESVQELLNELSIFWKKYRPSQESRLKILSRAEKVLSFCKFYLGVMLGAVAGFGLPPIQNILFQYLSKEATNYTYDYSKRVFLFMYPFEINRTSIYFLVLLKEEYLLIMSGIYWVCCDTLFAQFVTHTSLQFEILQSDIKNLISNDVEEHLKEKVIIFIKRHQELLRICKLIEDIFSPVIFATTLLTALNICVNLYEVRAMILKEDYAKTAFYGTLVIIILFSIIFYCLFAELLADQSSLIANSAYSCKWQETNHKLRVYLQMIIVRSQIPFYCTAYGFFSIGLKQFASIMSTSFSYYMMLQTIS